MDIKEFENLKKKQKELQLLKAKEEAKLEELNNKIAASEEKLRALGIEDFTNLDSLLSQKKEELEGRYNELKGILARIES